MLGKRTHLSLIAGMAWAAPGYALDSYRFLHVTIDTPWTIFVFLLLTILVPFVLMAILVWRYSERKVASENDRLVRKEGRE